MGVVLDAAHDWSSAVDHCPRPRDADFNASHNCRHIDPGFVAVHCCVSQIEFYCSHEGRSFSVAKSRRVIPALDSAKNGSAAECRFLLQVTVGGVGLAAIQSKKYDSRNN